VCINANELKDYIIEEEKVGEVLSALGCHDIKEYQSEFRCALPEKRNKTAVCVKKDNLSTVIRTSEGEVKGDIFTLAMRINGSSFGQANKYLHNIFGLRYKFNPKGKDNSSKEDPLFIFRKVKKSKYIVNQDIPIFDENELKEYIALPHIDWIREGIMPFACKRFNIGYSYDRKRIVIPERKWDGGDNEFIGISGRTVIPNYDILDIPKYTKLSQTYFKGKNVYGLNENYQTIQEQGYVIIFESQKSVLKRYSRKDGTGVAIGGCDITPEQVRILIGLNVDVIVALDNGIDINHIRQQCDKFYPIRNVSYIYDKWKLLGDKESAADQKNEIYKFLLKHRIQYDENERRLLNIWREKQVKN